jgi:tight adherence protein C
VDPALLSLIVFLGSSIGLLSWALLNSVREVQEEAEEQFEAYSTSPLYTMVVPLIQYIGRRLEGIKASGFLNRLRDSIQTKLVIAGKNFAITPDEFLGLQLTTGCVGLAVAAYFNFTVFPDMSWPEYGIFYLVLFYLPMMSLNDRGLRRQKAIRKTLPYALDLLCLAVEAGLDFTAALNRIGENLKQNPFRDELRLLSRDLTMGKTRSEALRDMERRVCIEELTAVVSALVQADELGASLGPALRIQSEELQRKRFQRAEKKAMQAPVLMLIPLVLFIFPLLFLIIFPPIALKVMDTLG